METNNFEQQVAVNEEAQKHAQEIQQTRVGGLGGSDAAIIYKIGLNGLGALTATDMKRLAIMTGQAEQDNWGGNAHTNAGHAFEDYAERTLPWGIAANTPKPYEREKVLESKLAHNFRTFAHADFVTGEMRNDVIECKFVQAETAKVVEKYYAQLQWYYMLGAQTVTLYHGQGTADPFEVQSGVLEAVERDEEAIRALLNGIRILDEALGKGWKPDNVEKVELSNTPEAVQRAFDALAEVRAKEAELKEKKEAASAILKEYIEDWGISSIFTSGEIKHQVIYAKSGTTLTFDAQKLLKEHPEFDKPEYYKKTQRAASVTFK